MVLESRDARIPVIPRCIASSDTKTILPACSSRIFFVLGKTRDPDRFAQFAPFLIAIIHRKSKFLEAAFVLGEEKPDRRIRLAEPAG